jgi:hypothetical protein
LHPADRPASHVFPHGGGHSECPSLFAGFFYLIVKAAFPGRLSVSALHVSDLKSESCIKKQKNFMGREKCTQIEMLDSNFQTATLGKWVAGTSPR